MNEMTILVELEEEIKYMKKHLEPVEMNSVEPSHRMQAHQAMFEEAMAMPTKPKRGPGRPRKVSDDIFMEVFNKAGSLKEAAQLLGLPVNSVSVKASNLRKTGCNVKRFRRGRKKKVAR